MTPARRNLENDFLYKEVNMFNPLVAYPIALSDGQWRVAIDPASLSPYIASTRDYGFDLDEDEVARELLAPQPVSFLDRQEVTIPADEFESLYQWFCS